MEGKIGEIEIRNSNKKYICILYRVDTGKKKKKEKAECARKQKMTKNVLQDCMETGEKEKNWIRQMEGGRKTLARFKRIKWIRNKREKKER